MQRKGRTAFILSFLAPAVLVYGWFVVLPFVQAVQFSAFRWRGLSLDRKVFVGFDNYRKMGQDQVFWGAVGHNLWLLTVGGAFVIVVSLLVAHAMRGGGSMARLLRSVYLFPQVISLVAVAVLWQFVFNPQGLLNGGLKALGATGTPAWLGDAKWALPAVGVAFVWYVLGFYVMLFAAGIESVPAEVFEAAELDGSFGAHRFAKVTWPLLWSVKKVAIVYLAVNVMNVFALVFLMTRGGPDRKSEVMLTYLYEQAFTNSQYGYATALAVGNLVVIMAVSLVVMFLFRRDPTARRA